MKTPNDLTSNLDKLPVETTRRVDESEAAVRNALDRDNNNPVTGIIHWRETQTLRQARAREIKQGLEYRRQALQMALDTRLQSMEEACNHVLLTSKTQLRQQRNVFFAEKLTELSREMEQITDNYIQHLDERLEQLESIRDERLRSRKEKQLERGFNQFMDALDKLEDSFTHIVEEGVNRQ